MAIIKKGKGDAFTEDYVNQKCRTYLWAGLHTARAKIKDIVTTVKANGKNINEHTGFKLVANFGSS